MALDLNKLINDAKLEQSKTNTKETNEDNQYKLLYPHQQGQIVFRLLPNNKANAVQRLIARHKIPDTTNQYGSKNVACMNAHYNEDCPICRAIKDAQQLNGKDCDAFRKFGYKQRGICYAYIVSITPEYKDIKAGDIVLFMYPKSVYTEIQNQIVQYAQNLDDIFNKNEGATFILENKKSATGFPEYSVKVNVGWGNPVLAPVTSSQAEYDALLNTLPDLNEVMVPSKKPDNLDADATAAADLIKITYGCVSEGYKKAQDTNGNTIANSFNRSSIDIVEDAPPIPTPPPATNGWSAPWEIPSSPSAPAATDGKPTCFGCHSGEAKCSLCEYEIECLG